MSNLFYSGSGRHTSGAFTVTMKDGAKLAKQIAKLENGGKVAIQRTVSDFNSRAPAWVSKGIRQHYGVDTAAIKSAGPQKKRGATHINVAGVSVDGATLEYKGRTLTPTHFKMSPKSRPTKRRRAPILIPGQMLNSSPDSRASAKRVKRWAWVPSMVAMAAKASAIRPKPSSRAIRENSG